MTLLLELIRRGAEPAPGWQAAVLAKRGVLLIAVNRPRGVIDHVP
jgi:hypothetical protein